MRPTWRALPAKGLSEPTSLQAAKGNPQQPSKGAPQSGGLTICCSLIRRKSSAPVAIKPGEGDGDSDGRV